MWPKVAGVFTFNRDGGFRYERKSAGGNARAIGGSFPRKTVSEKTVAQTPRKIVAAHRNIRNILFCYYILLFMIHTYISAYCVDVRAAVSSRRQSLGGSGRAGPVPWHFLLTFGGLQKCVKIGFRPGLRKS